MKRKPIATFLDGSKSYCVRRLPLIECRADGQMYLDGVIVREVWQPGRWTPATIAEIQREIMDRGKAYVVVGGKLFESMDKLKCQDDHGVYIFE